MSTFDFRGRSILVTGVGQRGQAGEVIASALGAAGARLMLIERQTATGDERVADLAAAGVDAHAFACDLTDAAALSAIVPAIDAACPEGLHGLVHLAGGFGASGPIADSDPAVWHRQIAINATTAYLTTRAFLPLLRRGKGAIVYFASAAALPGASVANLVGYAVSKAGVLTVMRAVAAEERQNGVRANALAPTAIRTATNMAALSPTASYVERETVALWVMQLLHPSSGPVSGQVIQLG